MMYLYDKAIENKLKKLFPRVVYAPVDTFYERYLESNGNQQIELPALSFFRLPNLDFDIGSARSHMNTPSLRKRRLTEGEIRQIYSMKMPLDYQLDIWASSDIDRDDLFTELMYALTLYPNISITYEEHQIAFAIELAASNDLTEISQFDSTGDLYRVSIPFRIPEARLFFYKDVKECRFISADLFANDVLDSQIQINGGD